MKGLRVAMVAYIVVALAVRIAVGTVRCRLGSHRPRWQHDALWCERCGRAVDGRARVWRAP